MNTVSTNPRYTVCGCILLNMFTSLKMVGVLPKVLTCLRHITCILLPNSVLIIPLSTASTTFNSLVENNQYSGRRRLKFLKDLSNGIVLVPRVATPRSLLRDFNVVSDSDYEEDKEADDRAFFNPISIHHLHGTIDSVYSGTSSVKELDDYLLHVSPTTIVDGDLNHHYIKNLSYPRPSIHPPPGF